MNSGDTVGHELIDLEQHRRRTNVRVLALTLPAIVVLGLAVQVGAAAVGPVVAWLGLGIAGCVVVGLLVFGMSVTAQLRALVTRLAMERPGSRVVLASTTPPMRRDAGSAGVSARRIGRSGGLPMAVAVEGDRVEVWLPGDTGPRWGIRLTTATVRLVRAASGRFAPWCIEVADGDAAVHLVPRVTPANQTRPVLTSTYADALRTLGEDPAKHLVMPAGEVTEPAAPLEA